MSSFTGDAREEGALRRRGRKSRLSLWHRFVLLVGYAAIFYGLARGAVYVLVLLERLV